jgi:iron(III) transport system substrate-binding protein
MRDLRLLTIVSAIAMLVAACDSKLPTETERPESARPEPVVVYASYADETYLSDLFSRFTDKAGFPVTVRYGEPAQLVGDVIANRGSPPADVLLTRNVADISRAAEEGALRPIAARNISSIPEFLRDSDSLWVATGLRVAVILCSQDSVGDGPQTYADLAKPEFHERVCLSSPTLTVNRSLIGMLISELGVRPTEVMVRGWVRNLALPPFETEAALFRAVDEGTCEYGIISSTRAIFSTSTRGDGNADFVMPQPAYFDIEGIGIARHARYPEAAQMLVDWVLSVEAQRKHALGVQQYSSRSDQLGEETARRISQRNVGLAGWHDNDAELLAKRAGYR